MISPYLKCRQNAHSAKCHFILKIKVQSKCNQNEVLKSSEALLLLNSEENEENAMYYV